MEQLFRTHDKPPVGVSVDNYLQIGVLGYTDDAVLVSYSGDRMSQRLTKVSQGSKTDSDMTIHKGKTKNMIVEIQDKIKPPTAEAILRTESEYTWVWVLRATLQDCTQL